MQGGTYSSSAYGIEMSLHIAHSAYEKKGILMTESSQLYDDEDLYSLPTHDPLGILSSTRIVLELGEHVWINQEQVELLCQRWLQDTRDAQSTSGTSESQDKALWDARYHFYDGSERTV